jgi:hypothetical protein
MRHANARFWLAIACGLPFFAGACGGSGGGPDPLTIEIGSTSAADGFVTDTGFVDTSNPIAVGDTDGSFLNFARGFARFDLSGLPSGSTLVSAVLALDQAALTGLPYDMLGDVVVDHVDIGPGLDSTDFGAAALDADVGILSSDATLGTKTLEVTTQVAADLAASSPTSDFRLRFPTGSDADGADDYTEFNDGEDSFASGQIPRLIVTYFAP